ncbi:exopolysaccharide biosynthesis polyprenyl glycosylphosphotransferase [Erythrobacter sp. NFXS35]|uniref:exopolysaccharide biosynthesis polyprenyl glycosylphosphotransferase n=1 Tax=Erythrobacter sp. NFXS35 TaxID=2818436 RepID=UPI0032DF79C8
MSNASKAAPAAYDLGADFKIEDEKKEARAVKLAIKVAAALPSTPDHDEISADTAAALTEQELKGSGSSSLAAVAPHRNVKFFARFELPLVFAGAFAPALTLWSVLDRPLLAGAFVESTAALAISIILAWYILSRLKAHANARHLSYVLPVNMLVFTGVFTVVALLRVPYSGSYYATGAAFAVTASFLLAVYGRRLFRPHVVVLGGRAKEIALGGHFHPAPSLSDLEQLIETGWRDGAIVADLHYPHSERGERLFAKAALAGIPVYHFRQIAEMQSGQVKIAHLSENELGSLIPNVSYASVKRLIDIVGALALIPLCLPFFAIVALLIRLDSPGAAFFIQERMGFRGKAFRMIKFRTMSDRRHLDSGPEQREDAMTKSEDNRITRLGRFLRKTRMDELPQVFNVLRGEMSFIGPRPEACALSDWYEAELPFYSYRHIVRPGITGWAQVNQGHVTDVSDVLAKLRYDFYYIKNISLWLDILVALKTLRVIATGLGAK